jgi:RNA polymerase sigma-B factor
MKIDGCPRARSERLRELHAMSPHDPRRARLRAEVVREHLPLARYLARRMAQRSDLLADVEQVASIGLLNAIDRFDPERGVEFTTFAVPTISGEIRRHFRDNGWCVHVPRRAQEMQSALREAEGDLAQELQRSPTIEEVADRLDVPVERVLEAQEVASAHNAVSTDVSYDGDADREGNGVIEPLPLPCIEAMRYLDQHTQAEIARVIGLSQMQVSRLLRRALDKLRERLRVEETAVPWVGQSRKPITTERSHA